MLTSIVNADDNHDAYANSHAHPSSDLMLMQLYQHPFQRLPHGRSRREKLRTKVGFSVGAADLELDAYRRRVQKGNKTGATKPQRRSDDSES